MAKKATTVKNETTEKSKAATPTLTCIITGKTRITNETYLAGKPSNFASNYISRDAMKLLREGKTVAEIREALSSTATNEISDRKLREAKKLNGKQKSADGVKSSVKTEEQNTSDVPESDEVPEDAQVPETTSAE